MKKIALALVILIVCVGGWLYWQWNHIDVGFDAGKEPLENVQPNESQNSAKTAEDPAKGAVESPKQVIEKQVQEQLEKKTVEQTSDITPRQLEKAILDKYQAAFLTMKQGYESEIHRMISRAKMEYEALSEQEKKKAKVTMALKYLKLGNALEDACDDSFNKVLEQMQRELAENGLPVNAVKEAKTQYEKEKSERRKLLMDKALGKL